MRRVALVAVGVLIIVFFMNYFRPYEQRLTFNVPVARYHLIVSGYALPFLAVMLLSQFGLRRIVCRRGCTLGCFVLLFLGEVLLVAVGFALWFCLYSGWHKLTLVKLLEELPDAAMALLMAYGVVIFSILLRRESARVALRTDNVQSVGDDNPIVVIGDEYGRDLLSVALRRLLYLRAADNYVIVVFREGDGCGTRLVRTTLKKVEQALDHPAIVRCHRSYMVNLLHVGTVERNGAALRLSLAELDHAGIPVSKSYASHVINRLKTVDGGARGEWTVRRQGQFTPS